MPRLRESISEFLGGTRDEQALKALVRTLRLTIGELARIAPAWPRTFTLTSAALEPHLLVDLRTVQTRLDPVAADCAEWAFRAWLGVVRMFTNIDPKLARPEHWGAAASLADPADPEGEALESAPAYALRLQALIMATIESVNVGGSPEFTADLATRAGDEARDMISAWERVGIRVDPFEGESIPDRVARTRRYARHIRGVLSDADHRLLEGARLGKLR